MTNEAAEQPRTTPDEPLLREALREIVEAVGAKYNGHGLFVPDDLLPAFDKGVRLLNELRFGRSKQPVAAMSTPPPWIRPWGAMTVRAPGNDDVFGSQENIDYAVRVVNTHDALVAALLALCPADLHETVRDSTSIVSERFDVAIYADDYRKARRLLKRLDAEAER